MADDVQRVLEDMVPELRDYEKIGVFSEVRGVGAAPRRIADTTVFQLLPLLGRCNLTGGSERHCQEKTGF